MSDRSITLRSEIPVAATTNDDAKITSNINLTKLSRSEQLDQTAFNKDRAYYRAQIKMRWQHAFKATMAVFHLIAEARVNLSPSEWETFVQEDCPFDYSVIQKFIHMAESPRLNDPENESVMPNAWNSLDQIRQMHESTFRTGIQRGIIHSGCTLEDLKDLRTELEVPKRRTKSRSHSDDPGSSGRDSKELCSVPTEIKHSKAAVVADSPARDPKDSEKSAVDPSSDGIVQDVPAKLYESEIAIFLSPRTSKQYMQDALALKKAITKLADGYAFIQCVDLHIRG